jgi:hypothetical protein
MPTHILIGGGQGVQIRRYVKKRKRSVGRDIEVARIRRRPGRVQKHFGTRGRCMNTLLHCLDRIAEGLRIALMISRQRILDRFEARILQNNRVVRWLINQTPRNLVVVGEPSGRRSLRCERHTEGRPQWRVPQRCWEHRPKGRTPMRSPAGL